MIARPVTSEPTILFQSAFEFLTNPNLQRGPQFRSTYTKKAGTSVPAIYRFDIDFNIALRFMSIDQLLQFVFRSNALDPLDNFTALEQQNGRDIGDPIFDGNIFAIVDV